MTLSLAVLGPLCVTVDGEPVAGLASTRLQALVVYLAVEADRAHVRRMLAEMIWPNRPEGEALSALRYALSNLRTTIGDRQAVPPFLHITRTTIQFNTDSEYELDLEAFQAVVDKVDANSPPAALGELEAAADLYRGDFMAGFSLPPAALFEEWIILKRERLARQMSSVLQCLAAIHEQRGAYEEAQLWVRRRLQLEPWKEAAHRQLMRVLSLSGHRSQALAQYEACCQLLQEELGVEPARATRALYEAIREDRFDAQPGHKRQSPDVAPGGPSLSAHTPLVAREDQLGRLNRCLEEMLAGQGQVVLIAGEPGSGKTALWQAFARQAMDAHPHLVAAAGRCSAQAGIGDPYLAFREVLQMLSGDIEPQRAGGAITPEHARRLWALFPEAVRLLVTYGPDLVDRFVPGEALLARAQAFAPPGGDWLGRLEVLVQASNDDPEVASERQAALFEQVYQVLRRLARRHPVIVILDDVQWADRGSLGLLFYLGRRLAGSRVLLIGAYRPSDLAVGRDGERHPLSAIVNELQRDFGEIQIDLDRGMGRTFVDAYLDAVPNDLNDAFRQALAHHTGGNPLFTVEMVDALRARGDLARDASGRWMARSDLDWTLLPARIEAVIRERVQRLSPQAQEILGAASIEGQTFTVEVLARMLEIDEGEVWRRLQELLGERHRLVYSERVERLSSDGRRLSHYRFRHVLFQKYLYDQLDVAMRAFLHRRAGRALEALYGGAPGLLAVRAPQLAHHFEQGGVVDKAIHYCQRAGEGALRLLAYEEALAHLSRGLDLVATLPQSAARSAQELQILLLLAIPMRVMRGDSAAETGLVYERALALCRQLGDITHIRPVLWLVGSFYTVRAEYGKALELYEYSLQLAEGIESALWVAIAHWAMGTMCMYMGAFGRAAASLDRMVACYDPERHHGLARQLGRDPGVDSLTHSAWTLWFLGYPEQALARSGQAVALADRLGHRRTQAFALTVNAALHHMCRSWSVARRYVDRASQMVEEGGGTFYGLYGAFLRGRLLFEAGERRRGLREMERALAAWVEMGNEMHRPYMMASLAELQGQVGAVDEGLALVSAALALIEAHDERYFEAEVYRIRGELLAMAGDEAAAEASLQRALDVARAQEAKSWQLRAALCLARLGQRQGQADQARRTLEGVYGWFGEEVDTPDLQDARAWLDSP